MSTMGKSTKTESQLVVAKTGDTEREELPMGSWLPCG